MASWTPKQTSQFREHVRDQRLVACWLLTLAGLIDFTRPAELTADPACVLTEIGSTRPSADTV